MNIVIPENDYKPDETCREEIVQAICDIFLTCAGGCGYSWYPESYHRIVQPELGFRDDGSGEGTRFTEAEMNAAWKALRGAGYHFFENRGFSTHTGKPWKYYTCLKRDYYKNCTEIGFFTERWT